MKHANNKLCEGKIDDLMENLRRMHGVVVAFSGGIDSSLVTALAYKALGLKALAITIDSPLMPSGDLDDAKRTAREIGIEHMILGLNELDIPDFSTNPPNRCYLCKRFRFEKLKEKAIGKGFETVADGTNLSDLREYRPGLKAAKKLGIYSPLLEAGLSKEDTRMMGDLLGLPTAAKPASPCLATRIPYGHPLEQAKLERIDRAEGYIRILTGVKVLRVRDHGNLARIEVNQDENDLLLRAGVLRQISQNLMQLGYDFVTLDLEGYRTGSFDKKFENKKE